MEIEQNASVHACKELAWRVHGARMDLGTIKITPIDVRNYVFGSESASLASSIKNASDCESGALSYLVKVGHYSQNTL